jgi:hypothetical protein
VVFERALAIYRLQSNAMLAPLTSTRPGLDMLSAPIPGPGDYLVSAPQ